MNNCRPVKILLEDGTVQECLVEYSSSAPWCLQLVGLELNRSEFSGDDLFEAQIALRRELEDIHAKLLCAGARPEAFPSGMSRGMGGGAKVYLTQIGKPALRTDLVDIFDYAEPDLVETVEEQERFHNRWVGALKNL